MWRSLIAHKHHESGQAVVEFAIVLPILLLLVMGIIQFGFILNGQITVTSAAREGARLAAVSDDDGLVKDRVEAAAVALLLRVDKNDIGIDRTHPDGMVRVTVEGAVEVVVPFLDMITGSAFPLSAETIMRIEYH